MPILIQLFLLMLKMQFSKNLNVELVLGDSSQVLFEKIKYINKNILFWLDGHADYSIPLLDELEQIKLLDNSEHIIMIDDVRMFGTPLWCGLEQSKVSSKIFEINKNYKISYEDSPNGRNDILIAHL